MLTCMVFVVGALIEFAVIVAISRSSKAFNNKLRGSFRPSNSGNANRNGTAGEPRLCWEERENIGDLTEIGRKEEFLANLTQRVIAYMVPYINRIDIISFFAYFFIFMLFNCIYWPTYL